MLADAGRPEDAVTVLERHPTANPEFLARYLTDLGRIEEAVAHLRRPRPRPVWPAATGGTDTPPFRTSVDRDVRRAIVTSTAP
ncbi:hypothetical protein [Embleya sp. NPDC059237]|uniref:hypothetical protein n=1 Tax=Embleya sp. NPDC059237 TaxID=3346784 RepID=UPI00369C00A3